MALHSRLTTWKESVFDNLIVLPACVFALQRDGRSIVFVDDELTQLPKFVSRKKDSKGGGNNAAVKFRAVSSTEKRVCLFPCHASLPLCKDVAVILGNHLQLWPNFYILPFCTTFLNVFINILSVSEQNELSLL